MKIPLWRRNRKQTDLEEEIQSHLQMATSDRVDCGESPERASNSARREFGNVGLVREVVRDMWGWKWLEDFLQDLRYAIRTFGKSPGFTLLVLITLALGIGANSAIFSVVDAVLLRPLPYHEPDRLVTLSESNVTNDLASRNAAAPGNFLDWRDQNHAFEQVCAVSLPGFNLTGADRPERVLGAAISADMFRMLGVQPALGRDFERRDDRPDASPVVLISHSLWQRRFGSDKSIVGKTTHLDASPYTILGVMPSGLQFPQEEVDVDLWVPIEQYISGKNMRWRNSHYLDVYARLKPGVTLAQARQDMNRIAAESKRTNPDTNSGAGVLVLPMQEDLTSDIRPALVTLSIAVGFVLLIACANVANLLLVRATGREKEMAMRLALGAGRLRLVRQLLTESVLLSLAGGLGGLLIADWARQALMALRPVSLPRYNAIGTDHRVLLVTLGLSMFTGILFGLVPAFRAAGSDLNLPLRGASRSATAGRGAHRLRNVFVVGEIAISLVLLVGAGLLIRSFIRLRGNILGFRADHTLTARVSVTAEKYKEDNQVVVFYDRLIERVRALPGVEAVGATSFLPLTGHNFDNSFDIVGRPPRPPSDRTYALVRFNDPGYFNVLGIPILRGRGIGERDRAGAPRAIVISESMVRSYWPDADPLGQHLKVYMGMDQTPWEIVGVVADVRSTINAAPQPTIYFPYAQMPYRYMVLTIRSHIDPASAVEAVRGAVRSLDPDQPVHQVRTLDELIARTLVPWRFSMMLLASFAALALLLASAGIYGVISYTVGQRTNEIGIRMALGAQRGDVLRLILRQGMVVALAGIAIGLVGALYLTRFLTTQLYGVRPTDAPTFFAVPFVLAAAAFGACYIPARRAMRLDPMVALRYE